MIREICFNPVIDKMYFIENFIEGNIYRKLSSEEYAGGKGINIAKALTTYGIPNCCYVTVAGKNGKTITDYLEQSQIEYVSFDVEGNTRTTINIIDTKSGRETELLEIGPYINEQLQQKMLDIIAEDTEEGDIPNIEWLSSTSMSKISVAIMNIWRMVGYFSLVLLSGMQKIPTSVYEAAKIDGANSWKVFFKITLPLMIPEIFFVALMSTIWIFQNVGDVMVLTQGGPIGSSTTLVYYMYMNAFEYSKLGYASAITYVLFLLLMLISGVVVKSYYTKAEEM